MLLDGARGVRSSVPRTVEDVHGSDPFTRSGHLVALALAGLWERDLNSATRSADEAVAALIDTEQVSPMAKATSVAMRAWADVAEAARAARRWADLDTALGRIDELAAIIASIADGTWLDGGSTTPWMLALFKAAEAERLRAMGRSSADAWRACRSRL